MALPYLSNSATTKSLIASTDSHLEDLSSQIEDFKVKIRAAKSILKEVLEKRQEMIKDPERLLKIYAVERKLKSQIKNYKEKLAELEIKEKRIERRGNIMKDREKMFEDLRIDVNKGVQSMKLERLKMDYETVEDGFVAKKKKGRYVGTDTKIRINYLQSQKKNLYDEILRAQNERDDRMKKKGEEYKPLARRKKQ